MKNILDRDHKWIELIEEEAARRPGGKIVIHWKGIFRKHRRWVPRFDDPHKELSSEAVEE